MVVEEQMEGAPGQHLAAVVAAHSSCLLIYLVEDVHIVAKSHLHAAVAAAGIGVCFDHLV